MIWRVVQVQEGPWHQKLESEGIDVEHCWRCRLEGDFDEEEAARGSAVGDF